MNIAPFVEQLRALLPEDWRIEAAEATSGADAVLRIRPPRGPEAVVRVEVKSRLSARQAADVAASLSPLEGSGGPIIVFTRFATPMARERLQDAGISWLDLAGNARIRIAEPAVFIERQGQAMDPDPPRRGVRSLKGAKAARIVRALCDHHPPFGVRELARRTGTNPGYVTRILGFLEQEDVVFRAGTGEVTEVRWPDLLRRWSSDYDVTSSNRPVPCLAPRGIPQLLEGLAAADVPYAVTGPFAVPPAARVVPGQLLSCYARSPEVLIAALDLRPTKSGANTILLEPFDEVVFEGAREIDGLRVVAPTQCIVDLWSGGSRDPAQADALLAWMMENEDAWRT